VLWYAQATVKEQHNALEHAFRGFNHLRRVIHIGRRHQPGRSDWRMHHSYSWFPSLQRKYERRVVPACGT
jgi:hypothetical protein